MTHYETEQDRLHCLMGNSSKGQKNRMRVWVENGCRFERTNKRERGIYDDQDQVLATGLVMVLSNRRNRKYSTEKLKSMIFQNYVSCVYF